MLSNATPVEVAVLDWNGVVVLYRFHYTYIISYIVYQLLVYDHTIGGANTPNFIHLSYKRKYMYYPLIALGMYVAWLVSELAC